MSPTATWPRSPFFVGRPITADERLFVGRLPIVGNILQSLEGPRGVKVLIHGPRRFGKTSLLEKVARQLDRRFVIGKVDVSRVWDQGAEQGWAPGKIVPAILGRLIESLDLQALAADAHAWHPEQFRTKALPRIFQEINDRRLVVFLDELEVLHDEDPSAVRQLLSAFSGTTRERDEVDLVIVWGRRFGAVRTSGQPWPFRDASTYDLEPLTRDDLRELTSATFTDTDIELAAWPEGVVDHLFAMSHGHPLMAVALCDAVWRMRSASGSNQPISIDELDAVVDPAAKRLRTSFTDIWRQLDLRAQLVLRALVDLAPGPGNGALPGQIATVIGDAGRALEDGEIDTALGLLADSEAVVRIDERWRVISPVLSQWLRERTLAGILNDHGEKDASYAAAQDAWQRARRAEDAGDLEAALASYGEAHRLAPSMWKAGLAAAQLELRTERRADALGRLRQLPSNAEVLRTLHQALLEAARAAHAHGTAAEAFAFLEELERSDPGLTTAGAVALLAELRVERWRRDLDTLPPAAWLRSCDDLAASTPGPWWPLAARYLRELIDPPASDSLDAVATTISPMRALSLVTRVVPWLTRTAPPVPDIAAFESQLSGLRAGGFAAGSAVADKIEELHAALAESTGLGAEWDRVQRSLDATWNAALGVLQRNLLGDPDLDALEVRVPELEALVHVAPPRFHARIAELVRPWLATRLGRALRRDPIEATASAAIAAVLRDRRLVLELLDESLEPLIEAIDKRDTLGAIVAAWPGVAIHLLAAGGDDAQGRKIVEGVTEQTRLLVDSAKGVTSRLLDGEPAGERLRTVWNRLLQRLPVLQGDAQVLAALLPDAEASAPRLAQRGWITEELAARVLGSEFEIERSLPRYRVVGVPVGRLRAFEVKDRGTSYLARIYALDLGDAPGDDSLVRHLWDTERRVLYDLGTHWEGRALPHLRDAHYDVDANVLVLVTEWLGEDTLRDGLDRGAIGRTHGAEPAEVWKDLVPLFEAVAAMHRAGFLHRAIRPEHVLVDGAADHGGHYRLINFEWTVYLYSLGTATVAEAETPDYYSAPELLTAKYGTMARAGESRAAESRAADTYALGLLTYECVVGPLPMPRASRETWSAHHHGAWLTSLIEKARDQVASGRLRNQELAILRRLLVADPNGRCTDLEELLPLVQGLAAGSSELQKRLEHTPVVCVTVLSPSHENSIGKFLARYLADLPPLVDAHAVAGFLGEDLRGARVFRNLREDHAPLILIGAKVNYIIQPLNFENRVHPSIGWLEVARPDDLATGECLAELTAGVMLYDIRAGLDVAALRARGVSWQMLFSMANPTADALAAQERRFHHLLRLMTDHEKTVARASVLEIEVVDHGGSDEFEDREEITIRLLLADSPDRADLHERLAQWFDRESHFFSIDATDEPFAEFDPGRRWMLDMPGSEMTGFRRVRRWEREAEQDEPDTAVLWRIASPANEPRPAIGEIRYIRPYSMQGSRTLYRRHTEVLDDLRYDSFLMRAVVRPWDGAADLRRAGATDFDSSLDPPKRRLAEAIRNRRPLFCVQGPPGTGKTTLAREVVLQALHENPYARILVTSQSHDPLDNLLLRIEQGIDGLRARHQRGRETWRRPMSVRLLNEERLSALAPEAEADTRQFHPSRQAEVALAEAKKWADRKDETAWADQAPQLRAPWKRFLEEQELQGVADSIERRLTDSANLVFATANDRRLAEMRPGSFDLLIYEEAGKSYPVEILGPMRLARRWLLIGDHQQLPPFDLRSYQDAIDTQIEEAQRDHDAGRSTQTLWSRFGCADAEALRELYLSRLRLFGHLYEEGQAIRSLPHEEPALFGLSGRLTQQWRMHPAISGLVREHFYEFLADGDEDRLRKTKRHGLMHPTGITGKSLVWIDVPPVDAYDLAGDRPGRGGGYQNPYEARALQGFMRELRAAGSSQLSTAILSPYRAQVNLLQELLENWDNPVTGKMAHRIFTVDSFQGRQADIVLISLVRNNVHHDDPRRGIGFLADRNRANVMFSRAERMLVVVGSSGHFRRFRGEENWISRVYSYIRAHEEGVVLLATEFLRPADEDQLRRQYRRRHGGAW